MAAGGSRIGNGGDRMPVPGRDTYCRLLADPLRRGAGRPHPYPLRPGAAGGDRGPLRRIPAQQCSRRKDAVGPITLERLAEAAREQRRLGLPILVSGGWILDADDSLADMMAAALESDFRVPVRWREERSLTTYQNALYSAGILRRAGVPAALVVTNPWHMARALCAFRAVGYPVVAAPTPERRSLSLSPAAFLPQIPSLLDSYYALHEMIGLAWYVSHYGRW